MPSPFAGTRRHHGSLVAWKTLWLRPAGVLLKGSPAAQKAKYLPNFKSAKKNARLSHFKRSAADSAVELAGPRKKRGKSGPAGSLRAMAAAVCAICGNDYDPKTVATPFVALHSSQVEHWSADVKQSGSLRRGGRILCVALPMHTGTGHAGRPRGDSGVETTSATGSVPHRYALFTSTSLQQPEYVGPVAGAMYATSNGGDCALHASFRSRDLLRSL